MSTKKTTIGGQAIIEGIVMKGPKKTCTVVRKPGGELVTKTEPAHHQPAFWRLPILRGAYTLFTAMKDGIVAINYSAEFFDDESIDEEPSKFEKWLSARSFREKHENRPSNREKSVGQHRRSSLSYRIATRRSFRRRFSSRCSSRAAHGAFRAPLASSTCLQASRSARTADGQ